MRIIERIRQIALYAYTYTADAGSYELSRHPVIGRRLKRVVAMPGRIALAAIQ